MEESCTIAEALDYIRLFPAYLKSREKLEQQRKLLLLSGNMQKLAPMEQLLCKLTPWNASEVQKEFRLYESYLKHQEKLDQQRKLQESRLYESYLKCREKLEQQRKLLLLSGNIQKLAPVEQLLCKLAPWNASEVQKKFRLYESYLKHQEKLDQQRKLQEFRLYESYLKCRKKLEQQRKLLLLSGNMQKLAHVEQLLCKLTPRNASEVQKEACLYEFEARELKLPRSSDLHAVGDFGQEFLEVLKALIKEIMKQDKISSTDQDKLERGSLVALYDILLHNKKWGWLFHGEERNRFIRGNQNEVDELMSKVNSDSAMGSIRLLDYKSGWNEFYHDLWRVKEGDLTSIYKHHNDSDFSREVTSVVAFGRILKKSEIGSTEMPCFFALVQQARRSPFAKYAIGYCYSRGLLVKQDKEKAKLWIQWAASEGCLYSQLILRENKQ